MQSPHALNNNNEGLATYYSGNGKIIYTHQHCYSSQFSSHKNQTFATVSAKTLVRAYVARPVVERLYPARVR